MSKPSLVCNVRAQATVRIEIELTASAWGSECQINQIYAQAAREAVERVQQRFQRDSDLRIVGTPKVTAIICPERE